MPYYMEKYGKDKYSGVLIETFKISAEKAQIKNYKIVMVPPSRMLQNMADGKAHVWNGIVLTKLRDYAYVGTVKLSPITLALYSTDPKVGQKQFPEYLKNKSLIVIKGFSYGGYVDELKKLNLGITFHETRNHESAIKMLHAKRAEYLLNYVEPMNFVIKKNHQEQQTYSHKLKTLDTYFAVSKKHPNAEAILHKLESGFLKIK